jgi:hypothetical protein
MGKLKFLLFILLFVLCSCKSSRINSPISTEKQYTNNQILLNVTNFGNTFKNSDPVMLELKYNSTNTITFPNNYNLRVFELVDNQWIEIGESPTDRYPSGEIVLSPNLAMPFAHAVVFFPNINGSNQSHHLRVYVFGTMETDKEFTEVTAFTDLTLRP